MFISCFSFAFTISVSGCPLPTADNITTMKPGFLTVWQSETGKHRENRQAKKHLTAKKHADQIKPNYKKKRQAIFADLRHTCGEKNTCEIKKHVQTEETSTDQKRHHHS